MSIRCPVYLTDNSDTKILCDNCYELLDDSSDYPEKTTAFCHLFPGFLLKQGQYEIKSVLGTNDFSITYKGINRQDNTSIAIKELWLDKGKGKDNNLVCRIN